MSVISVNNITFRYKSQRVLANIYARIPECKIYGLLGPSGAGKTTLLKLILGRVPIQTGSITVFGGQCGLNNQLIGYMPQDCALCLDLSVRQTILYFSNLYRISKFEERSVLYKSIAIICEIFVVYQRIKDLDSRLGLPEMDKLVSELSGGHQRQLSLGLALLHQPKLLILDEPTVGTDPELGNKIWKYLHMSCSEQNMSVLLVTHYTEEAQFAHTVGFMRDGRLIEEGIPTLLLDKFQEKSLENVFIRICKHQEKHVISDRFDNSIAHYYELDRKVTETNKLDEKTTDRADISDKLSVLWILMILIRRNINKYFRYKLIFLLIFSPAFQTLLMCLIYNIDSVPVSMNNLDKQEFN